MSAKLSNPNLRDPTAANAATACDLSSRAAFLGEPDIPESPQISPPDPEQTFPCGDTDGALFAQQALTPAQADAQECS